MTIKNCYFGTFGSIVNGHNGNPMGLDRELIRSTLKESGAILFRDFNIDIFGFKEFTDFICGSFMTHMGVAVRGRFAEFGNDTTITEVTMGENDLALHGEMYHGPGTPEMIWFYCDVPAIEGGQTTLADASQLYNELSYETQEEFKRKKLKYIHCDPPQVWQPQYGTNSIDEVMTILKQSNGVHNVRCDEKQNILYDYVVSAIGVSKYNSSNVFINNIFIGRNPANALKSEMMSNVSKSKKVIDVVFEDDSPISDELLLDVFKTGSRISHNIEWKPKDFVVVDNTRLLHGRKAFKGKRVMATRIVSKF
jgi:alpha-ketoglutarate-dependent taurine dioxygenase